jgi:hypothetical protein
MSEGKGAPSAKKANATTLGGRMDPSTPCLPSVRYERTELSMSQGRVRFGWEADIVKPAAKPTRESQKARRAIVLELASFMLNTPTAPAIIAIHAAISGKRTGNEVTAKVSIWLPI